MKTIQALSATNLAAAVLGIWLLWPGCSRPSSDPQAFEFDDEAVDSDESETGPRPDQRDGWVQVVAKVLRGEKVRKPSKEVCFRVSFR